MSSSRMFEYRGAAGMFVRADPQKGGQDLVLQRKLRQQDEMSGQEQAYAWNGAQEHFLEGWVAFNQASHFRIDGLELLLELFNQLQVSLFGKGSSDPFALNGLERILARRVLRDKLLTNSQKRLDLLQNLAPGFPKREFVGVTAGIFGNL